MIGFFWLAHHRFFARLRAVDRRFMQLNLLYLAAIAFMPFPTAVVGTNNNRPITVALYAVTLGVASLLEALMLWHAQRAGLLRARLRDDIFRASLLASLAPVVVFALSIPVAYLDADRALLVWLLIFPLEWAIGRFVAPSDAAEFCARSARGAGVSGHRTRRRQSLSAASSAAITGSGSAASAQLLGVVVGRRPSARPPRALRAMRMRSPPSSVWRR